MAQLWDYLDQELTADRIHMVRDHLETCAHCLPHAQFAEGFLAAIGRCRPTDGMPDGVRQKVMTALRDEGLM